MDISVLPSTYIYLPFEYKLYFFKYKNTWTYLYASVPAMHTHLSFNSVLFIFLVWYHVKLMYMSILIRFHHTWKKETSL